ncbi:DUF368 domain-containing protein [Chromatiaceae bacterium AAb-1]|nr:DUF368 domain-containing protein [Chromatiaceae bacterium AAb-1]
MQYLQVMIKGLAMGAADVVPGISGGTLAFILGIYERLLAAVSSFNMVAVRLLLKGQFRQLWKHVDGAFLGSLFGGVLLSIFMLANLVSWLLINRPVPLWAFFNGLMIAALPMLFRSVKWNTYRGGLFLLGIAFAVFIGMLTPTTFQPEPYMFFFAGAIAICAMILPGTSGSFMLVIMGMYAPVLLAVTEFQLGVLFLFVAGCVVGLLSFARFLRWLLRYYHDNSLSFLIGIVAGSFYKIWPWQHQHQVYLPSQYSKLVAPAEIGLVVLTFSAGILLMIGLLNLEKLFKQQAQTESAP